MTILNASHLKKHYGKDESLVKALDRCKCIRRKRTVCCDYRYIWQW